MTNSQGAGPLDGAALQAELSAVEIDIRCATTLAHIALQAVAEASPDHHVRVLNALDDAIDGVRLDDSPNGQAVAGLLTDVKLRLVEGQPRVWYIDE